ncbi:flippase Wzx [Clostridium sp. CAG:590]|mgnify:FL=1|nr:flippase Wzx [Clostridium sp. CAG:590]
MNKLWKKYKELPIQAKATICYTICNIMQRGISIITIPAYTRILTKEQYGTYSVFLSWIEIFEIIATFRLAWGGFVVGLTKYERERNAYCSSMQCLSITVTSIFLLLYLALSPVINACTGMNTMMTLLIFALLYAMPAIQFWTARRRVEYRYVSVLCVTAISSFLMPVLGVIAAWFSEDKATAVVGARVLVQGSIGLVLIWVNCHNNFTFYNKEFWKRALIFNLPLLPHYLSTVLLHSSDRIIIKQLVGTGAAGIYSVAYSASMAMQLFGTSISQSLQPWLFKKLKEKSYDGISNIMNLSLLLVAVLNLMLIILAPEAVSILAPKSYQEAIWIIPPLAASVVVMFFYQHFVNVEFFFEESRITSAASIGAALLNVGLNYWLIPKFGYLAAGYTTLASYSVFGVVHYIFMCLVCKKNNCPKTIFDIKIMLLIMAMFAGVTVAVAIGYTHLWLRLAVLAIILILLIVKRKVVVGALKQIMKGKRSKSSRL